MRLTSLCSESPFLQMKISAPTCMPQGKALANNDCWETGTWKYHSAFPHSVEMTDISEVLIVFHPRGAERTGSLNTNKDFSFAFRRLRSVFEWEVRFPTSSISITSGLRVLLKKKLPQIFSRRLRSPPTIKGWGVRHPPWRTIRKLPSLTCTKLSVGKGWT